MGESRSPRCLSNIVKGGPRVYKPRLLEWSPCIRSFSLSRKHRFKVQVPPPARATFFFSTRPPQLALTASVYIYALLHTTHTHTCLSPFSLPFFSLCCCCCCCRERVNGLARSATHILSLSRTHTLVRSARERERRVKAECI